MPPKPLISKGDIIKAAVGLVRERGIESINARSLANALNCSTRPLFRIYRNMEELKGDVFEELNNYYNCYMDSKMISENKLINQCINYIQFAQKEHIIFSALFMSKAIKGLSIQDIIQTEKNKFLIEDIIDITGFPIDKANNLVINMWFYSHGIATQIVSNGIVISSKVITMLIENAFKRFSLDLS